MKHGSGGLLTHKVSQRMRAARRLAEDGNDRRVNACDVAARIERDHPRRNIFENSLHQLSPALAFLDGLFQALRKLVDLAAALAELLAHAIEGSHQRAEF